MKKVLITSVVSAGLMVGTVEPSWAIHPYQSVDHYLRHKQHMRTVKRVGIGAAGGAVIGGLAAGGAGAGIGALAGGGAGALYDRHKRHHHQ